MPTGKRAMSEIIRLSYAELAERLGISREAAKSRVRRAGWLRVVDNSGVARFNVPLDVFDTPDRHGADTVTRETPEVAETPQRDTDATLAAIEAIRSALERSEAARSEADKRCLDLAEQVGHLKAERDAARAEIEELRRVPVPETPPTPKAAPLAYPPRRRWWPFG